MVRKAWGPLLAMVLLVSLPSPAWSGPILNLSNYATGAPGSLINLAGSGFGSSQGSSTVTFSGPIGGTVSSTTASVIGTWASTYIDDVQVPNGLGSGPYAITVNVGGVNSNAIDFTVTPYSGSDIDPHNGFSMATEFCNQCHTVHNGAAYGLLAPATSSQTSVVTQVCETCHSVSGSGQGTPINPGFFNETVGTTSLYAVYTNKNPGASHALGSTLSSAVYSSVSLGILNLNTTGYESSNYQQEGNVGLGCDSCHTAHGTYAADLWTGWDAAQFSSNYGYNVDGSVYNDPTAGHNESFLIPSTSSNQAMPLTSALLLKNPGYQGGVGNQTSNPYIPVADDTPVSRLWGQTTYGWSDNNLTNFCLGCHNLATGGTGHNGHPLQAAAGSSSADPAGSFAPITQGCMDCHGNPLTVWSNVYGGYSFLYPTSADSETATWDFPHTSPNAYFLKTTNITALCETCHYDQTGF